MAFEGGPRDRSWVAPVLFLIPVAYLVFFWLVVSDLAGVDPIHQDNVVLVAWVAIMVPAFILFLVDIIWLQPGRIRRSGVPATSWERTHPVVWEISGLALLLLRMPSILLFYAYLRPRLVLKIREALAAPSSASGSESAKQAWVFVATVVGWWVVLITPLMFFILLGSR
jgi:hypothetical protein